MSLAADELRAYTRDIEEEACSVGCIKQDFAGYWTTCAFTRKVARDGTLWRGVQPWGSWEGFGEVKELASVFLCLFCFGSFFPEREVSYWTMPFRVVICTSMARDNVKSSTAGMPGPPSGHYLLFINILQSSNAFS